MKIKAQNFRKQLKINIITSKQNLMYHVKDLNLEFKGEININTHDNRFMEFYPPSSKSCKKISL